MATYSPEIIFHFAAQPLVRESFHNPLETFRTNVMGTANVLEAARKVPSIKAIIIITTDKCYENKEWVWPYRENEALGGYDPYSSSKACSELVTSAYRQSFFDTSNVGIATARAGNVIGGGDFSENRLIPDFIRAIQNNESILLRYPNAIRPWQHVLEPLSGYLILAENLYANPVQYSEAWNFGPHIQDNKTVSQIVDILIGLSGKGAWRQESGNLLHEARFLKLDIQKAVENLNWHPALTIHEALEITYKWYDAWSNNQDMLALTIQQIDDFFRKKYE
jgi:CDP-glucose 4,6-dehydratase